MTITTDDLLTFCDRSIDLMIDAVRGLDDTSVNRVPDLPDANSAFQLVTHALAACRWWIEHVVCGHPTTRDRDAEFISSGPVSDLLEAAEALKVRLHQLAPEIDAATELAGEAHTAVPLDGGWTVGRALIHAYEELAQHLGHLDLTVDVVTR